mgnify:CR=1 FL=1|tara:strand:- start:3139 stop:3858 length:720 start_codon:yes stop_codon:yes gene_type:complete
MKTSLEDTHLAWLAAEVAKAGECSPVNKVLTTLRQSASNVNADRFASFETHMLTCAAPHTAGNAVFADRCNVRNLIRFLWDYMTPMAIPRFRNFFGTDQTAQLYNLTSNPTVAYSIVFDSPMRVRRSIVHPDGCRLVIYTVVVTSGESVVPCAHRKRQREAILLEHVVNHIDHLDPQNGVSLGSFAKWVANDVFGAGETGVTAYEEWREASRGRQIHEGVDALETEADGSVAELQSETG